MNRHLLSGPLLSTTLAPQLTPSAPLTAAPNWPPPPLPAEAGGQQIALGTEVIIQGLVKLPDFNGLRGVVQSLDYDSGRYNIHLNEAAGSNGHRWVKVKADNLLIQVPPPPLNAPTIVREGSSSLSASAPEFRPAASGTATLPVAKQQESPIPEEVSSVTSEKEPVLEQTESAVDGKSAAVKPITLN